MRNNSFSRGLLCRRDLRRLCSATLSSGWAGVGDRHGGDEAGVGDRRGGVGDRCGGGGAGVGVGDPATKTSCESIIFEANIKLMEIIFHSLSFVPRVR